MPEIQADRVGTSAVDRMQENLVAYYRIFAGLPGIALGDDDIFWLVSKTPAPGRQVVRSRIAAAGVEARIDAALEGFSRHTDAMDWLVFPACRPADLGARLKARGLPETMGGTWMLADLDAIPIPFPAPDELRIVQVTDATMLDAWERVSSAGFGSDCRIFYDAYLRHGFGPEAASLHYIGYVGDVPVTSSTLLLAGGIAGMFDISTPPAQRGRGYASAITLHMMVEGRARGYRQAWSWSSPMGKSVYAKLGFVAADFGVREYQWRKP